MAEAGRPRKPTALKIVSGTYRADRAHNEPMPDTADTTPPDSLKGKKQRDKYQELAANLAPVGLLTVADRQTLAALARVEVLAEQLERDISIKPVPGSTGQPTADPRWNHLLGLHKQAAELRREFGMSPSSRGKIDMPAPKTADPMEEFLHGNG